MESAFAWTWEASVGGVLVLTGCLLAALAERIGPEWGWKVGFGVAIIGVILLGVAEPSILGVAE
jgi:hypothetical protein